MAFADRKNDKASLQAIVSTFPGVYQMLPAPGTDPDDDHDALYERHTWGGDLPIDPALLTDARQFHLELAKLATHDRMVYVAGYGHPTPYRLTVDAPGRFRVGRLLDGDGRVALPIGPLEGVPTLYTPASHGGMVSDPAVLAAVTDLLQKGTTTNLATSPPARRARATGGADAGSDPQLVPMVPADEFDDAPVRHTTARRRRAADSPFAQPSVDGARLDPQAVLDDALRPLLGGGTSADASRCTLTVRVVHGSLEQTRHHVAVGHYDGLPLGGAEGFLDRKLAGSLRRQHQLGIYPGPRGTVSVIDAEGTGPSGAIVIGLGQFGGLSVSILSNGLSDGVLRLAAKRADRHRPDQSDDVLGVSAVLIGSFGRYGVSIPNAVQALVNGFLQSLSRMESINPDLIPRRAELELIELYEQGAEQALEVARQLPEHIDTGLSQTVDLQVEDRLTIRAGGRPGAARSGESGRVWIRIDAEVAPPPEGEPPSPIRKLTLAPQSRRAQIDQLSHEVDLAKINELIDTTVHEPAITARTSRTLYELLFPMQVKLDLDPTEALHLVADETAAQIPWELLVGRDKQGQSTPLALRGGMLRQFANKESARRGQREPSGLQALVIGDPPTAWQRLPGARDEARQVASLLDEQGWSVERLIFEGEDTNPLAPTLIDNALHAADYRIVHIAAHGVYDPDDLRSGVVTGSEPHHRLTTLDFRSMSVTPDLVFLNCCHLAQLGGDLDRADLDGGRLDQPTRLAPSVARQLMQNGVGAVVVAGWAIDDIAAHHFAESLYRELLKGRPLGEAVGTARQAAYEQGSTTWGAYQCYGNPDFQLVSPRGAQERVRAVPVSAGHLARLIDGIRIEAADSDDPGYRRELAETLDDLLARSGDLADSATVQEELGRAYADLGLYEKAGDAYQRCQTYEKSTATMRAIEQQASMRTKLARASGDSQQASAGSSQPGSSRSRR